MNIDQAVARACEEPTLLDALSWICVWESERAIDQARNRYGSGTDDAGWDTCFRVCLKRVMESYNVEFSGADKPRLSDSAGTQGYASGDKK